MRVVIVGYGVQGKKRERVAVDDVVGKVDPLIHHKEGVASIEQVSLQSYDAAFVCTDYLPKYEIIKYLLENGKHVLVEKPLWLPKEEQFDELEKLANNNNVVLYTSYNHRFEPHWQSMQDVLRNRDLGRIYRCRMSYGFGTAALARGTWRDEPPADVLWEIMPHLLDACAEWFGYLGSYWLVSANRFENKRRDHAVIASCDREPQIELEASWVSWRNHFTCDVYGDKGSVHIDGLSKWGPSSFTYRSRVFPSGMPEEIITITRHEDNTWQEDYRTFKLILEQGKTDLSRDRWIYQKLSALSSALGG